VVFGFVGVSASVAYLVMERAFAKKTQLLGNILSITVAISFAVNAGLSTSPGSPGSEPSNIYWASWVCFALAFYLCMCHVEMYLATWRTSPDKRMDGSHEQVQFVQEYHMSTNNSTFPMSTMALPQPVQNREDSDHTPTHNNSAFHMLTLPNRSKYSVNTHYRPVGNGGDSGTELAFPLLSKSQDDTKTNVSRLGNINNPKEQRQHSAKSRMTAQKRILQTREKRKQKLFDDMSADSINLS
jgi:hypothetical protein